MKMNKKQYFSLWFGIVAISIGGIIAINSKAYSSFCVWSFIVSVFTAGLLYSFSNHNKCQTDVTKTYRPKRTVKLIICLLVLIAASVLIYATFQRYNKSRPRWWLAQAEREAKLIPESWIKETVCDEIVNIYIALGDLERASTIPVKLGVKNSTIGKILVKIAMSTMKEDVKKSVNKLCIDAEKYASIITDLDDRAWFYREITEGLSEIGEIKFAKEFAKSALSSKPAYDSALLAIVKAQLKDGNLTEAQETLESIEGAGCLIDAYFLIAEAHKERGDLTSAKESLRCTISIFKKREKEIIFSHWTLRDIAKNIAKIDGIESSKALIQDFNSERYQSSILLGIAEEQADEEKIESALETAHQIQEHHSRTEAFIKIAELKALHGEFDRARDLLIEAYKSTQIAESDKDLCSRLIAEAIAKIGYLDQAKFWATEIQDTVQKQSTLAEIAGQQAKRGDVEGAMLMTLDLDESIYEFQNTCYKIAQELAKKRDLTTLARWIQSINNHNNRAYAFCGAAEGLIKKNSKNAP